MPIPMLPIAINMGLGALQAYGQHKALDPYADAYNQHMGKARAYANDPGLMYREDPALLQMRQQRMGGVQSRQLGRTGGTLGGNYARQLMQEGSAFDRAALQDMIGTQMRIAEPYRPAAMAQAQMGGPLGVIGGLGQQGLGDYMFGQFMSGLGGGGSGGSTVGLTETGNVPMVSQDAGLNPVPMWK